MTLYQFNALDEMEQAEALWDTGVHISDREDEVHRFILYQLDSFYVEVWLHKEYNTIRRLRAFNSMEQLEPYLEKIKLPPPAHAITRSTDAPVIEEYKRLFKIPATALPVSVRFRLFLFILLTLLLGIVAGRFISYI